MGRDVAEDSDPCLPLRDVAITEPGEDHRVEAPGRYDVFDRSDVELGCQTSRLEHATCELDGASADVEAVDAIAELEQRDQVAPRSASDQQDVIRGLEH